MLAPPTVPETVRNESGPGLIQRGLSGAAGVGPEAGLVARMQHRSSFYLGHRAETGNPGPELKWDSWVMGEGASGACQGRMLRAIEACKCPHDTDRETC